MILKNEWFLTKKGVVFQCPTSTTFTKVTGGKFQGIWFKKIPSDGEKVKRGRGTEEVRERGSWLSVQSNRASPQPLHYTGCTGSRPRGSCHRQQRWPRYNSQPGRVTHSVRELGEDRRSGWQTFRPLYSHLLPMLGNETVTYARRSHRRYSARWCNCYDSALRSVYQREHACQTSFGLVTVIHNREPKTATVRHQHAHPMRCRHLHANRGYRIM